MKTSEINWDLFEEKYNSVLQIRALLADTQFLYGEIGRGSGKSSEILAPRILRVTYDMPRSIQLIVAPTYAFILDTFIPGILNHLAKHYVRGIHYEFGKQPPKHFKRPYIEVGRWEHTMSFPWGTVLQFASMDRPESMIGKNVAHVYVDEMLRIKENDFIERVLPTLRGDRTLFGRSPYFAGITGFSSTPNFENDHDWWLCYEENMDKKLIEEIMYVAYRVMQARYGIKSEKDYDVLKQHERFIRKWQPKLDEKRKGATYYMKGSSFSNLMILGLDYIKNQLQGSKSNFNKFKLSILGIRPDKVKDMFFGKFSLKNIFTDSYRYNQVDLFSLEGEFKKTSRDLKHCDVNKPLIAGLDPGHFMSIVFAQENRNELRVIKNMYVIHPDQHAELARKINTFFEHHGRKVLYLHYDRAGNQRKYRDNPKGETDAQIMKKELTDLGWSVHLLSMGKRTIEYWEHYILLNILFGEKEKKNPRVMICQNECEELISSIYMSPLKRTEGGIELDKTAEKKLDFKDQALWSPQIASALMYMLFGLYEKLLPSRVASWSDYEGI
jgi:hypothetical protein